MAQKRMFSLSVVDTDRFMDMPCSTQALYFHLGMHGDDDGFVASPRKIARSAGCNDDDLRVLASKGYIIPFDSGVVVITDWKTNNSLKNDRYHETIYMEEKSLLSVGKSGRYVLGTTLEPECIQVGSKVEPEHSVAKQSVTEHNKDCGADKPPAPVRKKYGCFGWVSLTDDEYSRLLSDFGQAELDRCVAYIDESAQSTGNKNKWRDWNLVIRRCHRDRWGLGMATGKSDARDRVKTAADYENGESFV